MNADSSQYFVNFLNQYVKIPQEISEKLNTLYRIEYESVRHCIGLIIMNLLESGEVAYSRNKNFDSANHTKHYTYSNMMNALEIAIADVYVVKLQTGKRPYTVLFFINFKKYSRDNHYFADRGKKDESPQEGPGQIL